VRILAVIGSLQRRSGNRALVELAQALAAPPVEMVQAARLDALPHYDADHDRDPAPPPVAAWRQALRTADGVLIASPEYGHGMPGTLKNALDWIVGSGEFVDKPVAATCAAQAKGRGLLGLAALVQTLRAIDARVVASHPIVVPRAALDADGRITDAVVAHEVQLLLDRLVRG